MIKVFINRNRKSFTILIIFLLFSFFTIYGQSGSASVKGIITDSSDPIEFVNVYLTLNTDSTKIITGTTTDSLGNFSIVKIPFGYYALKIQSLGYITKRIKISLSDTNDFINLDTIKIQSDYVVLESINIVSYRKSIKRTEQGFVIEANDNLTQSSGSAADLLKNMPTVQVDADGVVTIRGKSPLIMINGRVSGLTGIGRTAQLERIPIGNIERIEINNNPSAKYDADAEAGIINIVLKTNTEIGTNVSFALGLGYGAKERLNGSVMVNHNTAKWNFGLYYNNWYTMRQRNVIGGRTNFNLPNEYFLTQKRFDSRVVKNQEIRLNSDYSPNERNVLSFNNSWAYNEQDNNETLTSTHESQNNDFTSRNMRHSNEIRKFNSFESEVNYNRTFSRKSQVLSANVITSFDDEKENTDIDVKYLSEDNNQLGTINLEQTKSILFSNMTTGTLDYKQAVADIGLIETGYKTTYRFLDADYKTLSFSGGNYITNPLRSNIFNYAEQIHALYTQYNGWVGSSEEPKWKYDFGIRAEQVFSNGKTSDLTNKFDNNYFNFFPSANLVFYPRQSDFYRLSYSRRINRPGLGDLNPFVDITDSLNQHSGNPELKPELINSFELVYNHNWETASFSFALFYRQNKNSIMPFISPIGNGAFLLKPINIGNTINYGFEGVYSISKLKFWNSNISYSIYNTEINGITSQEVITSDILGWYTKLINNFILSKNCKLQLSANYTSPVAIPQGKNLEIYYMDIGFQQKFRNNKAKLGIVFTDIFKTQKTGSVTSGDNFYFHRISRIDSQAFLVTFAYTFGSSVNEKLMENKFKNE